MNFFLILISTIIVNNAVLIKSEGICPMIGTSGSGRTSLAMSVVVLFTTLLSQAAIWPIHHFVLDPMQLHYLDAFTAVLVIACLVQLADLIMERFAPVTRKALGIYLPLTAANCAILSVCTENLTAQRSFWVSMTYALGTGLSFAFAMFLFSCIRMKLKYSDIPESFRGPASSMVAAAILAMIFMCFSGLTEGLFGMGTYA